MLKSDKFWCVLWAFINAAQGSKDKLKVVLEAQLKEVVVAFQKMFWRAMSNLDEIQCGGSASEDYRADTFALVVSKGKDYYDEVVDHPERVPDQVDGDGPYFLDVAERVLWERFGESLPDK